MPLAQKQDIEIMQHWMTYVKAAYEVIMIAEEKSSINLEHEVEAFVVHTFARYMEKPHIATEAIALKMLAAVNCQSREQKRRFEEVAEECLLIDGLELGSRRWPTKKYYSDMGKIALEHRAYTERPPELFYERVASEFDRISNLLHHIKL